MWWVCGDVPIAGSGGGPSWSNWSHGVGVNVWMADDGTIGDSDTPVPAGATVVRFFHGGHHHVVTDAEAEALTAAGWGWCVGADEDRVSLHGMESEEAVRGLLDTPPKKD
jgi:hypothetical protein